MIARNIALSALVATSACASALAPGDACTHGDGAVRCAPSFVETQALRSAMGRARARLYADAAAVLRIRVDEAGMPAEILLEQSSGNERADALIVELAQFARWEPATIDGVPVEVWVILPVTLDDDAR